VANPSDWLNQCAHLFKQSGFKRENEGGGGTYVLKDADSGLCTQTLSSGLKDMMWNNTIQSVLQETDLLTAEMDDIQEELPALELPALVSNPLTARDVVELVKFANENDLPVSVKNSGHSYSGQSSVGDSLLINMRRYPVYSKKQLYECDDVDSSDVANPASNACKLAIARNKSAVVRVGGGEGNDDMYRNVDSWNMASPRNKTYNVLGGGSGMVGGGGGWLLGGGLGMGNTDRTYGIGVDQVLELEMVLPDGRHVKFGPTEWEEKEGMLYPQTTKVEGLCNANVDHHEALWKWEPCGENEPNWEDLWFAVRGGGGGTFGVLLSSYHQLHDFVPTYSIYPNMDTMEAILDQCKTTSEDCETVKSNITSMWVDFLLDYMHNPSALGVTPEASNSIGYSGPAYKLWDGLFPYFNLETLGDPEPTLVKAWQEYVPTSPYLPEGNYTALIQNALNTCETVAKSWGRIMTVGTVVGLDNLIMCKGKPALDFMSSSQRANATYVKNFMENGEGFRFLQSPVGHMAAPEGSNTYWPYGWSAMIPVSALQDKKDRDFWIDFFKKHIGVGHHALGGNMRISSDGMTPQPQGYREAFGQIILTPGVFGGDYEAYETYLSELQKRILKHQGVNGTTADNFPGWTELNHQLGWYAGPLKDNWTKACPLDISAAEREERCMSVQETVFGTENLKRLQGIKQELDPKNLFSVRHGIGNKLVTPAIPPESFQTLNPPSQ